MEKLLHEIADLPKSSATHRQLIERFQNLIESVEKLPAGIGPLEIDDIEAARFALNHLARQSKPKLKGTNLEYVKLGLGRLRSAVNRFGQWEINNSPTINEDMAAVALEKSGRFEKLLVLVGKNHVVDYEWRVSIPTLLRQKTERRIDCALLVSEAWFERKHHTPVIEMM